MQNDLLSSKIRIMTSYPIKIIPVPLHAMLQASDTLTPGSAFLSPITEGCYIHQKPFIRKHDQKTCE